MRFTRYTDYAIRVLVHLGVNGDGLCSIAEIARAYDISENHLMKVVQDLAASGFIEAVRGRKGGLRLGRPAKDINLGALIRHTECGFDLVDCGSCAIRSACTLPSILAEAVRAFLSVLDRYTLADLLKHRNPLRAILLSDAA
ncbi:Rrf2 family transcriptional regulator [Acidiphilium acidophilum]|uniref:Rrf2 family transcriptional regulator n=1 Tax=Acidiphilium acidophilum TaxID=76588 RepID=A0AAW9DWV6_ACIAO|nr:Rrf2 family transcriptional regulator [Acidiphilium acidophilum]MDX5933004.1 Rrf2 family transcriptional regulator [Acidiphilium acidophilum]GBR73676.1 Rrf2 family transcriptional regulator [Acidiphilium acidophilum DSM 700]